MMIVLEPNNWCNHCGELLASNDDVVIRNNKIFHRECLPENLKDPN